jgi:hypothetical protein
LNRIDLQRLAVKRLEEAGCLLGGGFSDGAYYLAGYAVECALKAAIAKHTQAGDFPDKRKVNDSYSHELAALVRVAGLAHALEDESGRDPAFSANWAVAKDWSEHSRYEERGARAAELLAAIKDPQHGVMSWLQRHW